MAYESTDQRKTQNSGDVSREEVALDDIGGPFDRLYLTYGIFFVVGIGTLLPWNFFINAKEYFSYKLRNVTLPNATYIVDNPTDLQIMFESYVAVASMVPTVLFVFLNTLVTRWISVNVRIISSYFVLILVFGITIVLCLVDTDHWQVPFFIVTMSCVVVMSAASGVLQGAIIGVASKFPMAYCQAIMCGMGLGGTIAAVANILVLRLGSSPTHTGLWYFTVAEVFLFLGFLGYLFLPTVRFAAFHMRSRRLPYSTLNTSTEATNSLISSECPSETQPLLSFNDVTGFRQVFMKLWQPALTVFLVLFGSLTCFPAIVSAIKPTDNIPNLSKFFTAVICFLLYNFFDFIGRLVAGWKPVSSFGQNHIFLAVLRLGFIPLFIFCNVQPRGDLHVLVNHDLVVALLVILLGISNGYTSTVAMMNGPNYVGPEDFELAGAMMSFFLAVGLALGALASFSIIAAL